MMRLDNPDAWTEALKTTRFSQIIGRSFVFRFLTSENGKKLNGKHCTIVGADEDLIEGRYHCKLRDGRKVKAILCNLAIPESCIIYQLDGYHEQDLILPTELLSYLECAILWGIAKKFTGRADAAHRIEVMKKYRIAMLDADPKLVKIAGKKEELQVLHTSEEELIDPSKIPCGDNRYYHSKENCNFTDFQAAHYNVMRASKIACCGDGTVDFRRFSFGLCGATYLPECTICLEDIAVDDRHVIKLGCQHIFHDACISNWIENRGNTTCPTCKQEMPVRSMDKEYRLIYEKHLPLRLQEFIVSGFCEKCQSIFLEVDPVYGCPVNDDMELLINSSDLDRK